MRLYLVRHGESESDVQGLFGGDFDDALTEKGRAQAVQAAEELAGKGIRALFCSPKRRARESAEAIARKLDLPLSIVEDFRECNRYGILTGTSIEEAKARQPELIALLKDYRTQLPGGESYEDFKRRVTAAFWEVAGLKHEAVAVITHGGPIRCIMREILRLGELKELGDLAVLELAVESKSARLKSIRRAELEQKKS